MKIEYVAPSLLLPEMRVEIEVGEGDWPGVYVSRLASLAGRNIALEAPLREGVRVPLRPGTPLIARALSSTGLLSWDARVVERCLEPRPLLLVTRPPRLMVVQRRNFYRVSARLPVLFAPAATEEEFFEQSGVLVNLSGGGAALRAALPLRASDWLRLRLPIPDKEDELVLAAEVAGVDTRRLRWDMERIARLRWSGLSRRDEDRLFRFVQSLERARLRERRTALLD